MGRSVTCSCGQRNDMETFRFGEARQCLACGQPLSSGTEGYKAEEFVAEVRGFEGAASGEFSTAYEFESPSSIAQVPQPPPVERAWEGRVREAVGITEESTRCTRCDRAFRGAWDQHPRSEGLLCHLCASQAEKDYIVPEDWQRRELYRPVPPRKLHQAPDPDAGEAARKKRKDIILLSAMAVVTLVVINVFPLEDWMATLFSANLDKAPDLPVAWHWVSKAVGVAVTSLGQGIILYAALKWTKLLYDGGLGENWPALAYLSVVFALMDEFIGGNIITFIIKVLMISERFPLRMDNGISFLLTWVLCGMLLWPCNLAIHLMLQGIVSAIAL